MTEQTETSEASVTKPSGSIKNISDGRSDLYRLSPDKIHVKEGWNSRFVDFDPTDPEDIALANSIAVNGVKQPVSIYMEDGVAYLSDGHRRLGAVKYALDPANGIAVTASLAALSVLVEPKEGSEADRVFSQIIRNQGKPFTGLEQATVFTKLLGLKWTEEEIATKAGVSVQRVRDLLELNKKAPANVKKMIREGSISATLAITTLKKSKGDGKKAAELLGQAVTKAKTEGRAKATAKHVPEVKPDNPKVKLRAIFSQLDFAEDGEGYSLKLSADEYAEIRGLIGF